jgi:hypothetical protein
MGCKVLQFPTAGMKLLGDEVAFGELVKKLGLNVAERHLLTSEEEFSTQRNWNPAKKSGTRSRAPPRTTRQAQK